MTPDPSKRAGRYEKQREGFHAFTPAPLPPIPRLKFTSALQEALALANRALARLQGSVQTLPHPEPILSMFMRQEAVLSSKIDGLQSSVQDLLAAETQIDESKYQNKVSEVRNYIAAMKYGLANSESVPISTQLMQEIHGTLFQHKSGSHLSPGVLRTDQNWIGPEGCDVHSAIFVPPPPDQVDLHMRKLDQFIKESHALPVLVKIPLVHAQFETIHPFRNGNGRIGRLILSLMFCQSKLVEKPVLNLSWFFLRRKHEYYEKLQFVRDHGNWEDWLCYVFQAVKDVSEHTVSTIRRILELRENQRYVINETLGRGTAQGHRLLDRLYDLPVITVHEVQKLTGTGFAAANTLVARLVECGVLREEIGRARNRRFLLYDYVRMFNE